MHNFKKGDKVVFVSAPGFGQPWTEEGMKGVVISERGQSVPSNMMVECTTKSGAIILGEFDPCRFKAVVAPVVAQPTHKPMTIDVAHRLVAFDMELGCMQAELDNLRERIAQRMEEFQMLKDEYGVEE